MSSFENSSDTDMQLDETHTQCETIEETGSPSEGTQEISRGKLIGAIRELQKNMGVSIDRINVQRKTVLADYLNTRKRRIWFKPENRIKDVFIGEPAIDYGGLKREFFQVQYTMWHLCAVCIWRPVPSQVVEDISLYFRFILM